MKSQLPSSGASHRILPVAIASLALALFCARTLPRLNDQLFPDEFYWIGGTYYYDLAIHKGDVQSPDWQLLPGRTYAQIGRFTMGGLLELLGERVESPDILAEFYLMFGRIPGAWGEGALQEQHRTVADRLSEAGRERLRLEGTLVSPQLLRRGRLTSFLVGCGSLLVLVGVARRLLPSPSRHIVPPLVALHPVLVQMGSQAMIDTFVLFWGLLAIFFLLSLLWRDKGAFRTSVILGIVSAFTIGTKMTGLVFVLPAVASLVEMLTRTLITRPQPNSALLKRSLALGCSLIILPVVFIATDPALYPDVLGGLVGLYFVPKELLDLQTTFLSGALLSIQDRYLALGRLICGVPMFAVVTLFAITGLLREMTCLSRFGFLCLWFLLSLIPNLVAIPFPAPRYSLCLMVPTVMLLAELIQQIACRIRGQSGSLDHGSESPPALS